MNRKRDPNCHGASPQPLRYDPVPQRDERFPDPWNQGVNAEAFLYDDQYPAEAKALMMLFKRLREIDVPEMMAASSPRRRASRGATTATCRGRLWDEARHAMMGEVGFVALGVDWTKARITFNWSLPPQHRMHAARTARGAVLHRAGADAEDRQAVRVGGRRRSPASR